jgi:Uma2 family endonuclease
MLEPVPLSMPNSTHPSTREAPGGWWILFEPELHLGKDILVPDLAGWRRERLPRLPDTASLTVAPDWICEVVSPSSVRLDRVHKLPAYARHEVGHAWLIDPLARSLDVFRREQTLWALLGTFVDQDRVRAEPFEAVEIDLALLWPEPEASSTSG